MTLLEALLFHRDKINDLSPSPLKDKLVEISQLPPEHIIEDIVTYWCFKNYKSAISKQMHYKDYGTLLRKITPKTSDASAFCAEMSDHLKRLI